MLHLLVRAQIAGMSRAKRWFLEGGCLRRSCAVPESAPRPRGRGAARGGRPRGAVGLPGHVSSLAAEGAGGRGGGTRRRTGRGSAQEEEEEAQEAAARQTYMVTCCYLLSTPPHAPLARARCRCPPALVRATHGARTPAARMPRMLARVGLAAFQPEGSHAEPRRCAVDREQRYRCSRGLRHSTGPQNK